MATLAEFTIETIVSSLKLLPKKVKSILITGGGCRNVYLMKRLKDKLKLKIYEEKHYLVSPSAAANLLGAIKLSEKVKNATIVTTFADNADKYSEVIDQLNLK